MGICPSSQGLTLHPLSHFGDEMLELFFHYPGPIYFYFFIFFLNFACLCILLASARWLLGSSHSYSLLLSLNSLQISPLVPTSFNYINICYSQRKKK